MWHEPELLMIVRRYEIPPWVLAFPFAIFRPLSLPCALLLLQDSICCKDRFNYTIMIYENCRRFATNLYCQIVLHPSTAQIKLFHWFGSYNLFKSNLRKTQICFVWHYNTVWFYRIVLTYKVSSWAAFNWIKQRSPPLNSPKSCSF